MYGIKSINYIFFILLVLFNKIDGNVQKTRVIRSVNNNNALNDLSDNELEIPVGRTMEDVVDDDDDEIMNHVDIDNVKDINLKENEITESTTVTYYVKHKNQNMPRKKIIIIKKIKIPKVTRISNENTKKILKSENKPKKYNEDVDYKTDEIVRSRSKETKTITDLVVVEYRKNIENSESESMYAVKNEDFTPEEIDNSENEEAKSRVPTDVEIVLGKNVIVGREGDESFIVMEPQANDIKRPYSGFRRQMSYIPPKPYKESERPESICRKFVVGTSYYYEPIHQSEIVETQGQTDYVYPQPWRTYRRCQYDSKVQCVYHRFSPYSYLVKKRVEFGLDRCCAGYMEDDVKPRDEQGRLICMPSCKPFCVRARCLRGNNCVCHPGYKKLENSSHICIPRCYKECGGKARGECIAPNVCFCARGNQVQEIYVQEKGNFSTCVTQCPNPECVNSFCIGPQICKCFEGYVPHKTLSHICIPVCKYTHHGNCIAPEVAVCNEGYHRIDGKCIAICDKHCGLNGTCVANGTTFGCECDQGYKFDLRIQNCVPHCDNCSEGGYCVKPNKCICVPGYMPTKEGGCVFSCPFECGLGRCIGPNTCLCPKGYIFNKTAVGSKCIPFCRGCELGECISPRNCQCPRGYVYHVPKVGEDRRIKCIKTVKSYRYYDDRECKSMYDRLRRMYEYRLRMEKIRIAKMKWEKNRLKLKKEYEDKVLRENITREREKAKYVRFKAQRRIDKKHWLKQQRQFNQDRLERERKEDERIKKMHVEYKRQFDKPAVTWRNFARVAAASLYVGWYGVVFW